MKKKLDLVKNLLFSTVLCWLLSLVTCVGGTEYEIHKIPAARRAQMADFDWVGVGWIAAGMIIFLFGLINLLIAGCVAIIQSRRRRKDRLQTVS